MNSYVFIRGMAYVLLAMLTTLSGWIGDLTAEKAANLTWFELTGSITSILISGLLAFRSYIDGSAERNRNGKPLNITTSEMTETETKST